MAKRSVKIIPLGGVEEIGKNLTVIEYADDIIVVDCGTIFPSEDMPGVDLVIPDATYLYKNAEKVRGIIITHGHEDHIGAIPYIMKELSVPIYATELTKALIEHKLNEHKMSNIEVVCVQPRSSVRLGSMTVEFIRTNHSFAGAVAIAVHTPLGVIVHTGDFKIDYTPVDNEVCDLNRFAELGSKGVLALMSDSTNALRSGYTMSEVTVGKNIDQYFTESENKRRIIIATFSSNIYRIQQIINCAYKHNRKVCICGRSMVNICNIASKIGTLKIPENTLVDIDKLGNYPPEKIVVITTGSQGEPMSGLTRMANDSHEKLRIAYNDMVIISASPIPGNEKMVSRVINGLYRKGAIVVYEDVHVSGHACKEELKLMITLVKPKYFIPIHGEYRHLREHALIAESLGIPQENIKIPVIGNVIDISRDGIKDSASVQSGSIMVDGAGVGDVGSVVLRDRRLLAMDGLMIVVVAISSDGGLLISGPDIISRGFVYMKESESMIEEARESVRELIERTDLTKGDWMALKANIRNILHDFLWKKTKRNPMILPIVVEI